MTTLNVTLTTTAATSTTGVITIALSNGTVIHENYDVAGLGTTLDGFLWTSIEQYFDKWSYQLTSFATNNIMNATGKAVMLGNTGNDILNGDGTTDLIISSSIAGSSTTVNAGTGTELVFLGAGNDIFNGNTQTGLVQSLGPNGIPQVEFAIVYGGSGNSTININFT